MNQLLGKIGEQIKDFYSNMSPMKRTSMIMAAFIVIVAFAIVGAMVSGRSFVPLLKNVPLEQMPYVVAKLTEKQVPYKIMDEGKTLAIPPEFLHATQMMLMTETGLATIGQIGFELFDKETFGTTSFAQRVNYQRAVQGELSRIISTLDEVDKAKVIIALPPKKTFLEEGADPSASIVLDVKTGKNLKPDQVRGIIHLVSSAVEGMPADKVAVVDSKGKVLSRNLVGGAASATNDLMEYKLNRERELEGRIEEMLAKVVGTGKVIAKVNADINLKEISTLEEIIDPEKQAIFSVTEEAEKLRGNRTNTAGVPGARANLPGAEEPGQNGFKQDVDKELKTTNYQNTKTTRKIKEPVGSVSKITVAVLVDGVTTVTTNEEGETSESWAPRTEEELSKYDTIVKNAIGFNVGRGDSVKIENIKFEKEDFSDADRLISSLEKKKLFTYVMKWVMIAISFGLFIFSVVRPFMRWISISFQETVDDVLPKTIEELEDLQSVDNTLPGMGGALPMLEETIDPDKAESELLRERILQIVQDDNKKAAFALSQWIDERRGA